MNLLTELGDWLYSILVALALALFINIFLFQPSLVVGQSMEPTLHDGQRIFLSKLSHTLGKLPDYGDIVTIDSRVLRERDWQDDMTDPLMNWINLLTGRQPSHTVWVKRVIGKPGDTLEFKQGQLYRNGTLLDELYIKEPMRNVADKKITIPDDQLFVLGDNRNNSSDSRVIGPIPRSHVLGTMVFGL